MKKRFTEEQIIGILKEAEGSLKPAELCRKYGISEATYYIYGLLPIANGGCDLPPSIGPMGF
ncbi:transposase family protein [Burkholderia pseudomallei K42]|nr:transposase family protein [Burkholderia pseudomallei K42]